jgi:hypothetical protein
MKPSRIEPLLVYYLLLDPSRTIPFIKKHKPKFWDGVNIFGSNAFLFCLIVFFATMVFDPASRTTTGFLTRLSEDMLLLPLLLMYVFFVCSVLLHFASKTFKSGRSFSETCGLAGIICSYYLIVFFVILILMWLLMPITSPLFSGMDTGGHIGGFLFNALTGLAYLITIPLLCRCVVTGIDLLFDPDGMDVTKSTISLSFMQIAGTYISFISFLAVISLNAFTRNAPLELLIFLILGGVVVVISFPILLGFTMGIYLLVNNLSELIAKKTKMSKYSISLLVGLGFGLMFYALMLFAGYTIDLRYDLLNDPKSIN